MHGKLVNNIVTRSDHREEKQQYDSDYSLQNKNNSQSPSNSEYYPPSKIYQIVNNNLFII